PDNLLRLRYWSRHIGLVQQAQEPLHKLKQYLLYRHVLILSKPVMQYSVACNTHYGLGQRRDTDNEFGGTFIASGVPKTIPSMPRLAWNSNFVFHNRKFAAVVESRCMQF